MNTKYEGFTIVRKDGTRAYGCGLWDFSEREDLLLNLCGKQERVVPAVITVKQPDEGMREPES